MLLEPLAKARILLLQLQRSPSAKRGIVLTVTLLYGGEYVLRSFVRPARGLASRRNTLVCTRWNTVCGLCDASLNVPMAARNAVVGLIEVADGRGSVANAISAQALTGRGQCVYSGHQSCKIR